MFKKSAVLGFAAGVIFSGLLAAVVGTINLSTSAINLGGALIVIFGFASLIFGLTRKE